MTAYYLSFAAALLLSAIVIEQAITGWLNFMKLHKETSFSKFMRNVFMLLLTIITWTEFLHQSNLQKSAPVSVTETRPIRLAIRHEEWYGAADLPHTGRIIHAVFSPGDTTMVRWLEHREVIQAGVMCNYGPGWVTVIPSEEYPINDPVSWQPL